MNPIFKSDQHSSPNGQDSFSSQGECGTHTTNEKNIKYITDVSHYRLYTEKQEASLMSYIEEDESITKVVIPEFVIHNGEKYKVTSLEKECFMDCSTLTSIEIPESVTSLGDVCFNYYENLQTVICKMENVIEDETLFNGAPIGGATPYVPKELLDTYKVTAPWSGFGTILPLTEK